MFSVYQTLALLGGEKAYNGNPNNLKMELSAYMESLKETDAARIAFTAVANSPEKTRGSFMASSLSTLQIFSSQKLMKVLSKSDFRFCDFVDGGHALFVCNPDEKATYNRVASILYDQCYQSLVFEANRMPGRKLKKRVHMIYDEFGNMPAIENIQAKLTVALSRGIVYHLYVQDYKQLDDKYGNDVSQIIRSNCLLKYFISSGDYGTCKEFSESIGNETIWVDGQSGNYNNTATNTGGSVSYQMQQRPLIDANELKVLNTQDGKGIIVDRTYFGPCRVYLPGCSKYTWYDEMKTDETEVRKMDSTLHYAIPRCIEITDDDQRILLGMNSNEDDITIPRGMGMGRIPPRRQVKRKGLKEMSAMPYVKDLFWYWSMRDDLFEPVISHIHEYIKSRQSDFSKKRILTKNEIKDYMNSQEFFEFLNEIDQVDDEDVSISSEDIIGVENNLMELEEIIGRM